MADRAETLRILHLEDDPLDRALVAETLSAAGLDCDIVVADSGTSFEAALSGGGFDVILSDESLPTFDARTALVVAARLAPRVPFIVVSGTLGEDLAVERLKDGATDYLIKQRLSRLPSAILRAIRETSTRVDHAHAEAEVHRLNAELEQRVVRRTAQLAAANDTLAARDHELAEAKSFLEDLMVASPSLIFRIDPREFKITYASPNLVAVLGYEPPEVIGVRNIWRRMLHPDDLDRATRHLREAFESASSQIKEEYRFRSKEGRYRWFFSVMRVKYDGKGRPVTILWYCGDISDRRAAEQALLDSEERTRAILRTANDAFVAIDPGGRIVDWNARAEEMFGWPREEALGRILGDTIVPHNSRGRHQTGLAESIIEGSGHSVNKRLELAALRRSGEEFPIELTIWSSGSENDRTFNAFIRDITERKKAELAVQQAQLEAEDANRAKSEFLSRMSHDLRTPLNAVLGFAQLLSADALTDSQRECVNQIVKGGGHLLDLINEVLDIARIESGRLSLSPEPVDVRDIVQHAVELVRPLAEQRGIRLLVEAATVPSKPAVADRQRLSQILLNLLSNAVKYNRPGGSVTLSFEEADARVRINVTDTGAGIAAEKLRLLFQPFERLGAETTGIEGTGLGLTLARGLAEAMGGSVGVRTEVDRGSTFWVELEASAAPVPVRREAMPPQASFEPRSSSGPAEVLYIEDNASNVRLVSRLLGSRPAITLLHAADGETGLRIAKERKPEAIFLDLHLPDISGEEVLRQLWDDPLLRRIPVVVLSADATPHQIRRLMASGANAYLTKPLDLRVVLSTLDRALLTAGASRR
jgi:PAS domain S-box-containing protein